MSAIDIHSKEFYGARNGVIAAVWQAIYKGQLPALKTDAIQCVDCDERAVYYDHRDYSKPLDVVPVCSACNRKRGHAIVSAYTYHYLLHTCIHCSPAARNTYKILNADTPTAQFGAER